MEINSKFENQEKSKSPTLFNISKKIDLASYKNPRIAVTGDVNLTKFECEIIDTKEFQRLRYLKQLGTSYLVYPSAVHSRFEHSLGTLNMASLMVRMINENPIKQYKIQPEHEEIIRLAALLHDVTHIPFGHTLENETHVIQPDHDNDEQRINNLLGEDSVIGGKLHEHLGDDRYNLLLRILTTKQEKTSELGDFAYISDIVKNTVCADLIDYLKRDAYFCFLNLDFGNRFLKYLFITELEKNGIKSNRIVINAWKEKEKRHRRDIIDELIQLLWVRYSIGAMVYFHHAKIISSAMISRAVWSATNTQNDLQKKDLYTMGDDELLSKLQKSKNKVSKKLSSYLLERKLYKRLYTLTRKKAEAPEPTDLITDIENNFHEDADNRIKEEDRISELCGIPAGDTLIYCPNPKMGLKEAEMLITWKGEIMKLNEIDDELAQKKLDTINGSHENLWGLHVFIDPLIKNKADKLSILKKWCRHNFEPEYEEENAYGAHTETVLQILEDKNAEINSIIVNKIIQEIREHERGGVVKINRNKIEQIVDSNLNK